MSCTDRGKRTERLLHATWKAPQTQFFFFNFVYDVREKWKICLAFYLDKNMENLWMNVGLLNKVENIVTQGEIAQFQQFLLLPQYNQQSSAAEA